MENQTGEVKRKRKTLALMGSTYRHLENDMQGICIACAGVTDGCEPDARRYRCENCEKNTVYGAPELMIMGMLELVEKPEQETISW